MKNRIIRVSFFSAFSCILFFMFCKEQVYAGEITQWVRQGSGEITCGVTEWEREFCGGTQGHVLELTQTEYTTHKYQDYAYCPGNYDLVTGISFDAPPPVIDGQKLINLKATGTQTGTRDCCFIGDWFKYSVKCDGSGYGISPVADDENRTVDLMDSVNEVVNISDDLDVNLYLPGNTSIANECVITGVTSGGCSIKWVYQGVTKEEDTPNTKITDFRHEGLYYPKDQKFYTLPIILSNDGLADSGEVIITLPDEKFDPMDDPFTYDERFSYNIGANEQMYYGFRIFFPERMKYWGDCSDYLPAEYRPNALPEKPTFYPVSIKAKSISDKGGPSSTKTITCFVACFDMVPSANTFMLQLLLGE